MTLDPMSNDYIRLEKICLGLKRFYSLFLGVPVPSTKTNEGKLYEVSVKAIQGGGKWGIGKEDVSKREELIYVLLYYKNFSDVITQPEFWIIPAKEAQKIKHPWLGGNFAIYCSNKEHRSTIEKYKDAWGKYLKQRT